MNTKTKYLVAGLTVVMVGGLLYFGQSNDMFSGNAFKNPKAALERCQKLREEHKLVVGTREYEACKRAFASSASNRHASANSNANKPGPGNSGSGGGGSDMPPTAPYDQGITAGSLSVVLDSNTPSSQIVIAGRKDVEVARFKFSSLDEQILVTDLDLTYSTVGTGGADEVKSLKVYYMEDLGAPLAAGFVQDGHVSFNDIGMQVPKDNSAVMVVTADLAQIKDGADSGDQFAVGINSVKAVGQSSGEAISASIGSVNANSMVVRETKPTFTTFPYAGAKLNSGAAVGVYRFTVNAEAEENVDLGSIFFQINGYLHGNEYCKIDADCLIAPKLYDVTNGEYVEGSFSTVAGGERFTFANSSEVSSTGKTFELRADILGSLQEGDVLIVRIGSSNDKNTVTNSYASLVGSDLSKVFDVIWSDESSISHSKTSSDWTNAYLLKSVPTVGQILAAF